jgi:prepilin-type N-terminal cleavage/methylation domain-containing protein
MTRRGMTLIEMLVALTATLLLMAAIAQAFSAFGGAVSGSRSVLELDARMRTTAWRLRSDLAGATARTTPPLSPDSGEGYFEIIEGENTDTEMYTFAAPNLSAGTMERLTVDTFPKPFSTGSATNPGPGATSDDRLLGDHDDVLLFTTRSTDPLFIGRAATVSKQADELIDNFESTQAEVAWFARPTPGTVNPITYTLYRRQLLVMGYVGTDIFYSTTGKDNSVEIKNIEDSDPNRKWPWANFFDLPCDVSVRREGGTLFPNTLADLTKRENRFMHNFNGIVSTTSAGGFPFEFVDHQLPSLAADKEILAKEIKGLVFDMESHRQGEDVILTNVIAFDVRVFDPVAPVVASASGATAIIPGDPNYNSSNLVIGSGAYVDLGYTDKGAVVLNNSMSSFLGARNFGRFSGPPQKRSRLGLNKTRTTYDTWSTHYEANGQDEDSLIGDTSGVDQGTNGLDDDGDGKIDEPPYDTNGDTDKDEDSYDEVAAGDDPGELETSPPYPWPLRGIEVRIRCYEPSSRQVRQVTVRHTFVPH